jgi:hypothetical protein
MPGVYALSLLNEKELARAHTLKRSLESGGYEC